MTGNHRSVEGSAVLDLVASSLRVAATILREQGTTPGRHRDELGRAIGLIAEGLGVLIEAYRRVDERDRTRSAGISADPQKAWSQAPH